MKIPDFKPTREFFADISLPCLVAKVKNSTLPKVATRHIAACKEDPQCEIYLRCTKAREISGWQKEMLEYLLEKEALPAVLKEGMKDFETGKEWPGYCSHEKENYRDIKRYGIVPHLTLSAIVIDDVTREVIIAANTDWDGHLDEHGITIYLSKGRWRFDLGDRQFDYSSAIEAEVVEKQMATLFPTGEREVNTDTNANFLYGTWVFDREEALLFYKQLKRTRSQVSHDFEFWEGTRIIVSPTRFQKIFNTGSTWDLGFVGCKRRGDMVTICVKDLKGKESDPIKYWCKGKILMNPNGEVLKRESRRQRFVEK
jgi:hypothetical protein